MGLKFDTTIGVTWMFEIVVIGGGGLLFRHFYVKNKKRNEIKNQILLLCKSVTDPIHNWTEFERIAYPLMKLVNAEKELFGEDDKHALEVLLIRLNALNNAKFTTEKEAQDMAAHTKEINKFSF